MSDFVTYTKYRNLYATAVRDAKYMFERNLASRVKSNCSLFWKYGRNYAKVRSNIGTLECDDGSPTETDYEAANVLNAFLSACSQMSLCMTFKVCLTNPMVNI